MARRGIHDYRFQSHNLRKQQLDSDSLDEVDNVMSKLSNRQRRLTNERRSSFDDLLGVSNDIEDDSLHAKSLPTTTNFMSHFSFESEEIQRNQEICTKLIFSESTKSSDESESITNISVPKIQLSKEHRSTSSGITYLLMALAVFVAGSAFLYSHRNSENIQKRYNEEYFERKINEHVFKYNLKHGTLLKLISGVNGISDSSGTASLVFLYNSKYRGFNSSRFSDFVKSTASITAKYLRQNNSVEPFSLSDNCCERLHTHNEFMNKYKDNVAANGVMVVKDVDLIPANLAMAFHYYCDEFNPLIKRSAIYFTIDVASCENVEDMRKPSHVIVENCLLKKWHSIPNDFIFPLLTRLVSIVIDVRHLF